MKTPDERMGESLRVIRAERGLSIKELAGRSGLSTGMISQIERGRSSPSLRSLRLLAEALEVPISQFFESHQTPLEPLSPYVLMRDGLPPEKWSSLK